MYIRAVSVGHAVPRMHFDAVVHSVFDSAVNLMLNGDNELLTLLRFDEGDIPQGIRLEPSNGFSFRDLTTGTEAACRNGVLRFSGRPVTIDLQQAACWDGALPDLRADMQAAAARAAWACAWQALNDRQTRQNSDLQARRLFSEGSHHQPAWVQQAAGCMQALVRATQRHDVELDAVLRGLIGLGPGLTPSGDDLLAGYIIGLRCTTQGKEERIGLVTELARRTTDLSSRTNDISRTYLSHAARGRAARRLLDLARSVCREDEDVAVRASTQAAMQAGHTSGMDGVTGLLAGLAAWDAPDLLGIPDPGRT